jgi:hypothetical protein
VVEWQRVRNSNQEHIRAIAERASELALQIPKGTYDFDQAKDLVVHRTQL